MIRSFLVCEKANVSFPLHCLGGNVKINGVTIGILAAIGIAVSNAIALPLVKVFTLTTGELMMIRGGMSTILLALLFPKRISMVTRNVFLFSALFASANFCLYQGIRAWDTNPVIVILTATPVVNIVAKRWRGEQVDARVIGSLTTLLLGVLIALNPWQTAFNLSGCLWSVTATLLVGVGFEILGTSKKIDPYHKSFWIAALMIIIGFMTTISSEHAPFATTAWNTYTIIALALYGVIGGFLYILANVIAFEKLKTEVASVLAMLETPAVIIGARIILGETQAPMQWMGVLIALGAAAVLCVLEAQSKQKE